MHEKLTPKGIPYAPATIRQVLVLVKRVFNWGIEQGLYHGLNPCASIATPKFDNQVTNPLNTNSMESLMQVLSSWENERAVLAIKFALYTGKRKGEICKLTWDCVDLETGYITLKSTNTKSKETQTLPMNNKALAILHRCQELEICDYVFPSNEGSYYNTLNDTWKRIRKRAKINIRFHDLRHTYASYLASSGKVDIYTLKELLGHSTIEMTQRYAHLINGALKKAACVADEVF
jgi:integrase